MPQENSSHVYISSKQELHTALIRLSNIFVLLALFVYDTKLNGNVPELLYYVLSSQLFGADAYKVFSNLRSLKK